MERTMNAMKNHPARERIVRRLEKSGLEFELHDHAPVRTIDEARAIVPHLTRNLLKTVVFRVKNGDWVLSAVHGEDRIDYKKLAAALEVKRTDLRSISPDQVEKNLGFQIGGVGPFPVKDDVRVVIDEKLLGIGRVFCGSGVNTETVEIDLDSLVEVAEAEVAPISKG
jgi:Cys-tRNA(Pro)/Cys-tRNA(Cys) deacylase